MAAAHSADFGSHPPARERLAGIAITILVHVGLIAGLLQYAPVRHALATVKPIVVSVITTPVPEVKPPPAPKQQLPAKTVRTQAQPPVEKVPERPPIVAETAEVSPITLAVAEPPPAPVAQASVAPEPPPIVPPRFNADYLQNPAPTYPALARRMHEQGKVLIRVLVSVDGTPEKIELKSSSGYRRLDQSALETIRNWKFVPARQGERNLAAWVIVPIMFTLDA